MQQHVAPPQYSPDGRWWWNGRAWVRVTWPVQSWDGAADDGAYDEEPRRRTPAVLWVGLIALLTLLLLAFGATIVSWFPRQAIGIGGQAVPTVPPVPATGLPAEPAPTATPPSGAAAVDAYRQIVTADLPGFQAAGQAVAGSCTAEALRKDTAVCRAALQSLDDSVQHFRADLAATPVPACLRPADAEIRTSLALYHRGIQQELNGIDNQDLISIAQGAATLSVATNHAQNAGGLLQSTC